MKVSISTIKTFILVVLFTQPIHSETVEWQNQGPYNTTISNIVTVADDSIIFAKTSGSLLHRSFDEGITWESVQESEYKTDPNLDIETVGQFWSSFGDASKTIFVSSDGSLKSSPFFTTNDFLLRSGPFTDPTKTATQYAFFDNRVLGKTENRWESFFPITLGLPSSQTRFNVGSVFIHPLKPNILFASYNEPLELYLSVDGGLLWQAVYESKIFVASHSFHFDIDTPDKVYILTGSGFSGWGLYVISDDGTNPTPITAFSEGTNFSFDVKKTGEIFAFYDGTSEFGEQSTILNVGTPETRAFENESLPVSGRAIAVAEDGRIYLATTKGVYVSGDVGDSWTERLLNGSFRNDGFEFTNLAIADLSFDRFSMQVVAGGTNRGQVYKATISGSQNHIKWEMESPTIVNVEEKEKGSGSTIDDRNGITYTWQENSGRSSLTKILGESSVALGVPNASLIYNLVVDTNIPSILYIGTNTGLYKSENGGFDWKAMVPDAEVTDIVIPGGDTTAVFGLTSKSVIVSRNRWESYRELDLPEGGGDFLYVKPVYPDEAPFIPDHLIVVANSGGVYSNLLSATATLVADFNGNGSVDFPDFLLFIEMFGKAKDDEGFDARFDFNGDNVVGFPDFLLFVQEFGKAT